MTCSNLVMIPKLLFGEFWNITRRYYCQIPRTCHTVSSGLLFGGTVWRAERANWKVLSPEWPLTISVLHRLMSRASLPSVVQAWPQFLISASTPLCQAFFGRPLFLFHENSIVMRARWRCSPVSLRCGQSNTIFTTILQNAKKGLSGWPRIHSFGRSLSRSFLGS